MIEQGRGVVPGASSWKNVQKKISETLDIASGISYICVHNSIVHSILYFARYNFVQNKKVSIFMLSRHKNDAYYKIYR